jgi:hypothetical protein
MYNKYIDPLIRFSRSNEMTHSSKTFTGLWLRFQNVSIDMKFDVPTTSLVTAIIRECLNAPEPKQPESADAPKRMKMRGKTMKATYYRKSGKKHDFALK